MRTWFALKGAATVDEGITLATQSSIVSIGNLHGKVMVIGP